MNAFELRDARDTVIDLLPFRSTFPLRNLPVNAEREIVSYDSFTYIIIGYSQPEVYYEVYDNSKNKINEKVKGNGGDLKIKTGQLTNEDYTFSVLATKAISNLNKLLLQTATVKVGVDTGLDVSTEKTPIDYNTPAVIIIAQAQRGALYQAFEDKPDAKNKIGNPLSTQIDSGSGGDISITTSISFTEDIVVRIQVTNIKTGLKDVLIKTLQIKVKPNISLQPALKDKVADYNGKAIVTLNSTQQSVTYQLKFEDIDNDLADKVALQNTNNGDPKDGSGVGIELQTEQLTEDLTLTVLATKKVDSNIAEKLTKSITIPVRPDPVKKLSIVDDHFIPATGATIRVSATQRGILYQLRSVPDRKDVGRPAYHHKNYGIAKARMGIEFAIGRFDQDYVELQTGPLDKTSTFEVWAIKATTKYDALVGTITAEVK